MPTNPAFQLPIVAGASPVTVLAQGVGASHTGDTNETILATIPVSAGVMGANGIIVIRPTFTKTGTAGTATPVVRFGLSGAGLSGTSLWTNGALFVGTSQSAAFLAQVVNAGATNSQLGSVPNNNTFGQSSNPVPTAAIDTTQATEIVISCSLGNSADTINLAFYQALLYPHA